MNTFPEPEQLELPEPVKTALLKHLTEPFQTPAEAKAYWEENSVQVVLSEPPKDAVPEYTDQLPDGYTISLIILSDGGGDGIYYLTPPGELK